MNLNDMLKSQNIDPERVIVFRHRPTEPELMKVLPWLAAEHRDLFNAYQQTQSNIKVENALKRLTGKGYVASFIGHEPGKAIFVALYKIESSTPLTPKEFKENSVHQALYSYGGKLWFTEEFASDDRPTIEWFDFVEAESFYGNWKGKLIVDWPGLERSWWRRAHKNDLSIFAIHEESEFDGNMPEWRKINFTWEELKILPSSWKKRISQWRGIYYIFDVSDGKGYVGSAYGENNLIGRWINYGATGHGDNKLLRKRDPSNFHFSILERVSPDLGVSEVIQVENSWKERLHTYAPNGLNAN